MMREIFFMLVLFLPGFSLAVPMEGTVSRFALEAATWQEQLSLQTQSTGTVEQGVANYKGLLLSVERQWRYKTESGGGGYGIVLFGGQGQASGGQSTAAVNYKRGSQSWTLFGLEPRLIHALSESIDVAVGVAGISRTAEWPNSSTTRVTATNSLSATFFLGLDVQFSDHFGMRQSLGITSADVGPFMRWGLVCNL